MEWIYVDQDKVHLWALGNTCTF